MDRRRWTIPLWCALAVFVGCTGRTAPELPEAALGLTRRLPAEYLHACTEIQREMHVNPCPPLVPAPDGTMDLRAWADSLDVTGASVLASINGRDIDAHVGHWTVGVAVDRSGRQALAGEMHATGAKTASQCRDVELERQRVEACRVPPYSEGGGYYGGHIAYAWQRGDVTYHVTLHGHANEPRLRLMMAALIAREMSPRIRPRFEAATITRCPSGAGRAAADGSHVRDGERVDASQGRATMRCRTVGSLVTTAYVQYEDGLTHSPWAVGDRGTRVAGGPSWIHSDQFTVDARAAGAAGKPMLLGPMLQTLLEDRFKVKVHYETRLVPVYDLAVAGGGWPSRLPSHKEGCIPRYAAREDAVPELTDSQRWCAFDVSAGGARVRLNMEGATIDEFANLFLRAQPLVDHRIRNRTGVPGRFDFRLDFASAFLFTALQEQLGVTLEGSIGSGRVLVIDEAQRP